MGAVDEGAFDRAVRESLLAMTRVAKRFAPDADPEDVVQESLVKAWTKRHQFDPSRGSATAWLIAITVSRARDARAFDNYVASQQLAPSQVQQPSAVVSDLENAMSRLPRRQRTAVELHYFVDLSISDVAQVMGCSDGTVKSTLYDARRRLSQILGDTRED